MFHWGRGFRFLFLSLPFQLLILSIFNPPSSFAIKVITMFTNSFSMSRGSAEFVARSREGCEVQGDFQGSCSDSLHSAEVRELVPWKIGNNCGGEIVSFSVYFPQKPCCFEGKHLYAQNEWIDFFFSGSHSADTKREKYQKCCTHLPLSRMPRSFTKSSRSSWIHFGCHRKRKTLRGFSHLCTEALCSQALQVTRVTTETQHKQQSPWAAFICLQHCEVQRSLLQEGLHPAAQKMLRVWELHNGRKKIPGFS